MFTLRYDEMQGGFDETQLLSFTKDKTILSVSDHFYIHEGVPRLTLVVTFNLGLLPILAPNLEKPKKARDDSWRKMLRQEDYPMFDTLREWRAERAKADGVPPYVVCLNKHLAEMVRMQPERLADLSRIEGFGKSKREKYGKEILKIFAELTDEIKEENVSTDQDLPEESDA